MLRIGKKLSGGCGVIGRGLKDYAKDIKDSTRGMTC